MGIDLHDYQTTLKSRVTLSGIGVHSGKPVSIQFHAGRRRIRGSCSITPTTTVQAARFRALVSEVGSTDLCTVLGDPSGHHVATVEHVMAALFGLGIDNLS